MADVSEIPKPDELLAARGAAGALFDQLRAWFAVPESVSIDLSAIDSAVEELGEPQLIMAMAMRKLQALHLITTPGVVTTTDVVLTMIQDLERALLQAPTMHLKQEAADTDWDAALSELDGTTFGGFSLEGDGAESQPGDATTGGEAEPRDAGAAEGAANPGNPGDEPGATGTGDRDPLPESPAHEPVPDDPSALDDDPFAQGVADSDEGEDEIERFRRHHAELHEAARAVLRVSEGRICRLI